MKIRVLGSAAGGGFPQWNCNCRNCAGLRAGTLAAAARTQSSIAVRGDDSLADAAAWALVNASPDILAQLAAYPDLQPRHAMRESAIAGIVLVDGQVDHTTGLYMLREATRPWQLWCTDQAYADLTLGNPILKVLAHYCGIERRVLPIDATAFRVDGVAGVRWRAVAIAGQPAPYSPHRDAPVPGDNVALIIEDERSGRTAVYAPGLGAIDPALWTLMQAADCVMIDGTFWTDDEMIGLGLSKKTARAIGHLPQSGPGGMLDWLGKLPARTRRVLIHINNTNPILDERSAERAQLDRLGIRVAADGDEIDIG